MIRTWDPQIRNLVLYPAELPGRDLLGSPGIATMMLTQQYRADSALHYDVPTLVHRTLVILHYTINVPP